MKKILNKKIYQLSLISNNKLLVLLCGNRRMMHIKPTECLIEGSKPPSDTEIYETENAISFAVNSTSLTLCVVVKGRLLLYKLYSEPRPYRQTLIRELNITQVPIYLEISKLKINNIEVEILWYGYSSTLVAERIDGQSSDIILRKDEDLSLQFLHKKPIDRVIHVSSQ
jgi:hypothetical protein